MTPPRPYRKNFLAWASVAAEVELRAPPGLLKPGAIHWAYLGVNIGFEQDGKGASLSRPILIVGLYGPSQVLALPLSSRRHYGQFYYPLRVNGAPETALLNHFRMIDRRRVGDYLDEISSQELQKLRRILADLVLSPPPPRPSPHQ